MPDPSASTTKVRSLNRWSIGTLSLLQIASLLIIVVMANFLSSYYFLKRDLSRGEDYSLSQWTRGLLESEPLQSRSNPVKFIVAFRRSTPITERVRVLADEYARLSHQKIVIERLDPVRNVDRALQIAETYNLAANSGVINRDDLVIIDARPNPESQATKDDSAHIRFVTQEQMVLYENNDGKTARRMSAFRGEDMLTTGLLSAIEGKPRIVYFLADKSDFQTEVEGNAWTVMRDCLLSQNILPVPIKMSELDQIPADAAGLIIAAPRYDFTPEEITKLSEYWNRPASNMMVILRAQQTPDHLRSFLREHGVTPRRDQIVTSKGKNLIYRVDASFTSGFEFTRDFWGKSTSFDGISSSLEVREGAEDLINRRISPFKLLESAPHYWGETNSIAKEPSFSELEDRTGPLTLAAAVIRGAASDDRFAAKASRMIVISNGSFLDPAALRTENVDFFNACSNWLVGREEMSGTGPRKLITYKLPIMASQATLINRINLFFLPAAVLVWSLFLWNARRA
ncbi:MAG: hypothetical protein ACOVRB_07955 [Akkermansiaceae bacterium]